MRTRVLIFSVLAATAMMLAGTSSSRADVSYSFDNGTLAASADFNLTGSTLTVTLTNTSANDVLVPTDVLTGLFFNTSHTLTPVSASLNGSSVFYGSIVNNVGEGWSYAGGINAHGDNAGISAAGLGVFGQANFFSPPVTPLDGIDYGILSAGDNSGTGNGGVTGGGPLIKNSIQFTLTAGAGFSLSELGNVVFQYGTSLTEPSVIVPPPRGVPEPTAMVIAAVGAIGFVGYGLRRRKQS